MLFRSNDTATTEIYTLSLHDALPILELRVVLPVLLGGLLAVVLLVWRRLAEWLRSTWSLHFSRQATLTPRLATLQYQKMLRLLERGGLRKAAGQTPLEFVAAVPLPELCAPVAQLTDLYQAARFGERTGNFQQMAALLDSIRALLRPRR